MHSGFEQILTAVLSYFSHAKWRTWKSWRFKNCGYYYYVKIT